MSVIPKISVIVPVYKAEQYLHRCVDSILTQSFTDFELLLVDDGSPDICGIICDEYAEKDSRVRVFHKPNGGVSTARNFGIEVAKGDWVFFSDADDELVPNALKILTSHLDKDVAYVMGGYRNYNEGGNVIYEENMRSEKMISQSEAITQMFRPTDYAYQGYLWNKLFKLSIIKEHNLQFADDIYFNEDRLFNIVYLLSIGTQKCFYTTEPVYNYVVRFNSAMASLKMSYYPKFATDLTAFVRALEVLKSSKDKHNIQLCKWAAFQSYRTNLRMMRKFDAYDKALRMRMYRELREQVSIADLANFHIRMLIVILKSKLYAIYTRLVK